MDTDTGMEQPVASPELPRDDTDEGVAGGTPTLLLSLLLPLLIAVLFLMARPRRARGNKVVLFGPTGGGKTAMHLQLRFGRLAQTVTSMQPTSASVTLPAESGRTITLVDAPGSGRLRSHLMGELPDAAVLVCVLDGTRLATHAKEAADLLYDVLTQEAVDRSSPPLLFAVNKSDEKGAAAPAAARKALEEEVGRVRRARTTLDDTGGQARLRGIARGDMDQPFSFDSLPSEVPRCPPLARGARPRLEPHVVAPPHAPHRPCDAQVHFFATSARKPELSSLLSLLTQHVK